MKSEAKKMVDIKGLDKARVMSALCAEGRDDSDWRVDIFADEFDEGEYDKLFGEGAAQRAVDSVRAELEGSKDTAGNTLSLIHI